MVCPSISTSISCSNLPASIVWPDCEVPKQSRLKSQIRWRCFHRMHGLWNLSFSHGSPGHFETVFDVGNCWGFWGFKNEFHLVTGSRLRWIVIWHALLPGHLCFVRMIAEWPRGKVQKLSVSSRDYHGLPSTVALWISNPLVCLQTLTFYWDLLIPLGDGTGMQDDLPKSPNICRLSKVRETAFELRGDQFQFRPGHRHFTWDDGTVQTVQSIHKTPD